MAAAHGDRTDDAVVERAITTVLFTDIESSTQSWERDADAMARFVRAHDDGIWAAVEGRSGRVVKGLGDGVMACFADPGDAVAAAIDIQRLVDGLGANRVRIGAHLGEVELRSGDLFGPTVNRAARLMSAASGGQVVLSSGVADAVAGSLPVGVELRDVGVHRLKDLAAAVRVYQVVHEDLPDVRSPLRSLTSQPNNLPSDVTPIVGRGEEAAAVASLLRDRRLVTLSGPGGVGKTRLALQVAAEVVDEFPDGVWWVELAGSSVADVLRDVATAAGVAELPGVATLDRLVDHLGARRCLIVVDNFEHVIESASDIASLIARTSDVVVLVTSRTPLDVRGEVVYRLAPLDPVDGGAELFMARAGDADPRLAWSESERDAARSISERLDGLPLAIELAAAQCRVMPPAAIAERLTTHLGSLRGGRDRHTHHRTIDALVEWSYQLLGEGDRTAFEHLSIFAGTFDVQIAEAIDVPVDAVLSLADQSLLQLVGGDAARYRMLDTVRSVAADRLAAHNDLGAVTERHTSAFLDLSVASDAALRGPDQEAWHRRLALSMDDFRTVLRRLVAAGDARRAVRMVGSLGRLWHQQGMAAEAVEWSSRIVPTVTEESADLALALAWWASYLATTEGDDDGATLFDEAERVALATDARLARAYVANGRGILATRHGHLRAATDAFRNAVERWLEVDPEWSTASSFNLATALVELGDLDEANEIAEALLEHSRARHDQWGVDSADIILADIAHHRMDVDRAEQLFEQALESTRRLMTQVDIFNALQGLADVYAVRGDVVAADQMATEADRIAADAGMPTGIRGLLAQAAARLTAGSPRDALPWLVHAVGVTVFTPYEQAMLCLVGAETGAQLGHSDVAGPMLAAYDGFIRQHDARNTPLNATRRDRVISIVGEDDVGHIELASAIELLHTVAARSEPGPTPATEI